MVMPDVAICTEKVQFLQKMWGDIVRVEDLSGAGKGNWYPGIDVAVCTIEKANLGP